MNEKQLKESIEEITKAIKLIMECKGMSYTVARGVVQKLSDERAKFRKEIKKLKGVV
jgi:hypothetical protein